MTEQEDACRLAATVVGCHGYKYAGRFQDSTHACYEWCVEKNRNQSLSQAYKRHCKYRSSCMELFIICGKARGMPQKLQETASCLVIECRATGISALLFWFKVGRDFRMHCTSV